MAYRFEKLVVWQKAMAFCGSVYEKTKQFPKDELYGMTSQLRRAATSIPLNIAEGSACKTKREFIQFLYVALRSLYEVVTIIRLAHQLRYLDASAHRELEAQISGIGRLLQALINAMQTIPVPKKPESFNQQPTTNN